MPSQELLAQCYSTTLFGYPSAMSIAKRDSRQAVWYSDILNHFDVSSVHAEIMADVGAGEGLLVEALSRNGTLSAQIDCYDYHSAPPKVRQLQQDGSDLVLKWVQADLSLPDWMPEERYDRVFCVSVIEHAREPQKLVSDLLSMCKPGGRVHIIGPCVDSVCYALLKSRWPYIVPGEHLTIPSMDGLEKLVGMFQHAKAERRKIKVSYSLKYALSAVFQVNIPSALDMVLRLPAGAFAMTITKWSVASGHDRRPGTV